MLILIFFSSFAAQAVDYITPAVSWKSPAATMQSVNNSSYMATGSAYSSDVYEIGSSNPYAPTIRKGLPGGTGEESDYDPNNPQFAPVGAAFIPLMLMALAFMGITYLRIRRKKITQAKCLDE